MKPDSDGRTALLLMDFHAAIVGAHAEAGSQAVTMAGTALENARTRGIDVFHVVPHYRHGYPELRSGEPFDSVRTAGLFREPAPEFGIDARLRPRPDEPVVAKCRYSPFFANELLHLLRMRGVGSLALAGIATSGVVLSAVRDAWDRDYEITVIEDACADPDPEIHRMLMTRILPAQARVLTVRQWSGSLRSP